MKLIYFVLLLGIAATESAQADSAYVCQGRDEFKNVIISGASSGFTASNHTCIGSADEYESKDVRVVLGPVPREGDPDYLHSRGATQYFQMNEAGPSNVLISGEYDQNYRVALLSKETYMKRFETILAANKKGVEFQETAPIKTATFHCRWISRWVYFALCDLNDKTPKTIRDLATGQATSMSSEQVASHVGNYVKKLIEQGHSGDESLNALIRSANGQ